MKDKRLKLFESTIVVYTHIPMMFRFSSELFNFMPIRESDGAYFGKLNQIYFKLGILSATVMSG